MVVGVESDTYVEEHWSLVTTLSHMLRSVGYRRTCDT